MPKYNPKRDQPTPKGPAYEQPSADSNPGTRSKLNTDPMTHAEKWQLFEELRYLTNNHHRHRVVDIMRQREPSCMITKGIDTEVDFAKLKSSTLREIESFVTTLSKSDPESDHPTAKGPAYQQPPPDDNIPSTLSKSDANPMTRAEKLQLAQDIRCLATDHVHSVIGIIRQRDPSCVIRNGGEIEIDFNEVRSSTLREIESFVATLWSFAKCSKGPKNPNEHSMVEIVENHLE